MKTFYSIALVAILGVLLVSFSACSSSKPEQINLILRIDKGRSASLKEIMAAMANRIGMKLELQDFDYGGESGTLKAALAFDSRTSVMVRSISTEECSPREGRRDPSFSPSVYGVSIYRTSVFQPKLALHNVAEVLREEAQRRGGSLVTENQKCADVALSDQMHRSLG